jgi:hypothetical protein
MTPLPMSEPAPIWHEAPCPALELWLDAGQPRWQLNRAGVEWALDAHRLDADWQALAQDWLAQQPAPIEGQLALGTLSLRYRAVAVPPRWLLWLQPGMASAPALREGWPEAADKLALMQGFGRIGFVERDARTGRGWWDKNMFRMVGLEPALQPPSFDEALQRVPRRPRVAAAPPPAGPAAGRPLRDPLSLAVAGRPAA